MADFEQLQTIDEAADWLRRERLRMGWTAKHAANEIIESARLFGDEISLSQQAISFFERGKGKSFPRWLRYFDAAIRRKPGGGTDGLRESDNTLADDEALLLEWFRGLKPPDRAAVLQLTRSLAMSADSPSTHDPGNNYKGEGADERERLRQHPD